MRISVVVLVYNLEAYVAEALDSVLSQTRPADEIIVVDDCSTDGSASVLERYAGSVRILRLPQNSGALLTALHGIKAANGDVICMLDGDDYWETNKLSSVEREFAREPGLMLLSHDHVRVDVLGRELSVRDDTHANIAAVRREATSAGALSDLLRRTILEQRGYWLGSAYSFRRSMFDVARFERQLAGFDRARLRLTYLDLVIAPFLVLTQPDGLVGYAPDTRLFYRVHDAGSMSGAGTPEAAERAASKGRAVNELIAHILRCNAAPAEYLQRRQLLLAHYDYLIALYRGRMGEAGRLLVDLAAHLWSGRQLRKEVQRYLAVLLLGPARFLRLKNRTA